MNQLEITLKDFPYFKQELDKMDVKIVQVEIGESKLEKKSLFKKFMAIFSTSPLVPQKIVPEKSKEQLEIEQAVDMYLQNEDLLSVTELVNNNYQLTKEQNKKLSGQLIPLINNEKLSILNNLMENGIYINNEVLKEVFFNYEFQIYCHDHWKIHQALQFESEEEVSKKYTTRTIEKVKAEFLGDKSSAYDAKYLPLAVKIDQHLSLLDNKIDFFSEWLKIASAFPNADAKYYSLENSIISSFEYFNEFLVKQLSLDKKRQVGVVLKELKRRVIAESKNRFSYSNTDKAALTKLDEFIIGLNIDTSEINNPSLQQIIEKTRMVYGVPIKTKKLEFATIENKDKLSVESQELIKEIERIYNIVIQNKELIQEDSFLDAERFINIRIPEMIDKYLSLDPKYKDSLKKDDGTSAKDLLNESLTNIYEYIEKINYTLNQHKFSDLSAKARYTRQFKK